MSKTAYIVRFGWSWSGLSPCNPVSERRTVRSATPISAAEAQLYGTICRNVAGFSSNMLNYCGYWRMLHPLSPDRVRCIHGQPELRALVRLGERVAAGAAGEAALRANGEPLRGDILRRFIDAPLQPVDRFEYWRFAADQPEHYALFLRDEAQRRKITCSRGVILKQEMVRVRAHEKTLRNPFVSAVCEVATPEVAAAHVDADDDLPGTPSERAIDRIDVVLDQRIGIAACDRNPVADRRIAHQRTSDLVDLQVPTARRDQLCDLLLKHADEIGEEPIDVAIGGTVGKVRKPQKVHRGRRRQRDLWRDRSDSAQENELVDCERMRASNHGCRIRRGEIDLVALIIAKFE